tara:strand:- start:2292 stop:2453 length:162 start_codon:yes stop_codon:yes gene_type:complete
MFTDIISAMTAKLLAILVVVVSMLILVTLLGIVALRSMIRKILSGLRREWITG